MEKGRKKSEKGQHLRQNTGVSENDTKGFPSFIFKRGRERESSTKKKRVYHFALCDFRRSGIEIKSTCKLRGATTTTSSPFGGIVKRI